MKYCGSDFTNTFRTLSHFSRSEEMTEQDKQALETIISFAGPEQALQVKRKPKFSGGMLAKIK